MPIDEPPSYCRSHGDIYTNRFSWLSITIFVLSVYSTVLSGLWLVTAIVQPRWGHRIASSGNLIPATATLVTALVAKTIELSFVTVFVAFLGQVLTRKSILRKTRGMTLAEMTMRNWVFQPGSLITHWETIPYAGLTLMGALALTATAASMFYTTASDAMVSPKLKYGGWESKELQGYVRSSYANAQYVGQSCHSLLEKEDEVNHALSCLSVQFSGQSYRDLLGFMSTWEDFQESNTAREKLSDRPSGTTLLYDNTTLKASWIETQHSDIKAHFEDTGRIINNVTLAYPHPGLYAAAMDEQNGILQPSDLGGIGEYSIHAGVASPAVNVMCVNMNEEELEPLVYTKWPDARTERTGVGNQRIGVEDWDGDVPQPLDDDEEDVFLNETIVDDIFRWGPKYGRRPPVFQLVSTARPSGLLKAPTNSTIQFPADYNLLINSSVYASDSIYLMGKSPTFDNYTLCELKSWLSPNCSSRFDVSGRSGASMKAHCEDPLDDDNYSNSFPKDTEWSVPVMDWKWIADAWRMSMDLNGGTYNNNASNARILTQLAISEPSFPRTLPSLAEALAVFASSTAVLSAIDTPFVHFWGHEAENNILDAPGEIERFNATLRTQQYTSGHVSEWHKLFYIILTLVFGINCFCLAYLLLRSGLVTDFTEPQNLFALAVNSPPSEQLKGSCGAGPQQRDLVVPWRVAYAPSAEHYFFEEANAAPWRGKYAGTGMRDGDEGATVPERKRTERTGIWKRFGKGKERKGTATREVKSKSSYKRLSSISKRNTWL